MTVSFWSVASLSRRTGISRHKRIERGVPSAPSGRPTVTAVVTAYNYGRYLAQSTRSALEQDGVDARVVIVDDCSHDETPLVAKELARDPRVTVIRNERNLGLIGSFNEGLKHVRSEYVVKLDADDILLAGAWARATALLERHPKVAFVYGRPHHFSGAVPHVPSGPTKSWTLWTGSDWVAGRCRNGANVISQPEVVVRTAALRAVGGLSTHSPQHTSDINLWIQLAAMGDVGRINGPAQGLYRVHEASMLRTSHAGLLCDLEGRRGAFEAAFAGAAARLPDAPALHDLVRRTLAANALDRACRAYDRGRTREVPVDALVAFALETDPRASQLKEWEALERRRVFGPDRAQRRPRFFAAALARRTGEEIGYRLWLRTGEW